MFTYISVYPVVVVYVGLQVLDYTSHSIHNHIVKLCTRHIFRENNIRHTVEITFNLQEIKMNIRTW